MTEKAFLPRDVRTYGHEQNLMNQMILYTESEKENKDYCKDR